MMKDDENGRYLKLCVTGAAIALIAVLGYFFLYRIGDIWAALGAVMNILKPFVYGAVIAYILTPGCNKLERLLRRIPWIKKAKPGLVSGLSILIAMLLALAIVWVLIMLVIPQVWNSVVGIANAVPGELASVNAWLHNVLADRPEWQESWDNFSGRITAEITDWLKTDLLSSMGAMISGLGSQVTVFFGVVKNLFLGILISVYILASRKKFAAQSRMLLRGVFRGRAADMIEEEVRYADRMFNGFLMGKLLDSAIIGALCFIGTTVMGIQSAALVSVIVGITNIIPFFGPFIGAIPCALLIFLENPLHCLYFIIFVVILQQLDGNVIGPKILGNSTGLSSFWVMFAILLFGGLWGITGMIVGVPLCAVLYDIARRLIRFGLKKHGQSGIAEAYDRDFHPAAEEKKGK